MTDIAEPFDHSAGLRLGRSNLPRNPRLTRTRRDEFRVVNEFDDLLALARSGSTWAWSQLYAELARPVLGYLKARGAAEPEDLLSEVFINVVRGLHTFHGDSRQFRSWVFTIAHRRLIDERRFRGHRPIDLVEDVESPAAAEDPATEVIERLTDAEIIGLIQTLTPEQRDVLLLRVLAGLTIEETSRAVGKTPGAVKALQRRGLLALQEKLSDS